MRKGDVVILSGRDCGYGTYGFETSEIWGSLGIVDEDSSVPYVLFTRWDQDKICRQAFADDELTVIDHIKEEE